MLFIDREDFEKTARAVLQMNEYSTGTVEEMANFMEAVANNEFYRKPENDPPSFVSTGGFVITYYKKSFQNANISTQYQAYSSVHTYTAQKYLERLNGAVRRIPDEK